MKKKQKIKALALLSGGLDSTLAVKLIQDQGIEVIALNFTSLFCTCNQKGVCFSAEVSKKLGIRLIAVRKGDDYFEIVKKPEHGYGSAMNPCIDCRIYILKQAKKIAKKIGAKFIFTGEVLDQRPMSQHLVSLKKIEKCSGLEGKILRPLSAKLLPETEAEKKGWVDRNKLLEIRGRGRKPQINLAKELSIKDYACPAGGCLLTDKGFAVRLKDLFRYNKNAKLKHAKTLRYGRHFRLKNNKIIVGRNERENSLLTNLKGKTDYLFEVKNCGSPITLLQGAKTKQAIAMAAALTARYSDAQDENIIVSYGAAKLDKKIIVKKAEDKKLQEIRI